MSKQTGNLIKLQSYGTRSSNVVGSMYYWLVSWPQQRAKAIKSRGGWRPPGDAAKGWTGKRVQLQKRVREQKRVQGHMWKPKAVQNCQLGNFGPCNRLWVVTRNCPVMVICIICIRFSHWSDTPLQSLTWLVGGLSYRFVVDQMMFTSRDRKCDNRADFFPSRVKAKQNLILFKMQNL